MNDSADDFLNQKSELIKNPIKKSNICNPNIWVIGVPNLSRDYLLVNRKGKVQNNRINKLCIDNAITLDSFQECIYRIYKNIKIYFRKFNLNN